MTHFFLGFIVGTESIYVKVELGLSLLLLLLHLGYHGFQLYQVLLYADIGAGLLVFLNVISAFSLGVSVPQKKKSSSHSLSCSISKIMLLVS